MDFVKNSNANLRGTSFHGTTILATYAQIKSMFGEPCYYGDIDEKVTREWVFEAVTEEGVIVVSLYDWKEGCYFGDNVVIGWHVGGKCREDTEMFKEVFMAHANQA